MAVTRSYTYLGKIEGEHGVPRHIVKGTYAVEGGDLYDQGARPTLTFSMLSKIEHVIALYPVGVLSGLLPCQVSLATRILTFGLFESGGAAAAFTEKTDDEAYGAVMEFDAIVIGY